MDLNIIEKQVKDELESAIKKFKPFNSPHEGYAVILEEFEELKENVDAIHIYMEKLWSQIKANNNIISGMCIDELYQYAFESIKEAIQIAAMVERYNMDIIGKK